MNKDLIKRMFAQARPDPGRELVELLGIYTILQLCYIAIVFYKHEFEVTDGIVLAYFIEKFVFDFTVFMAANLVLVKVLGNAIGATIFSALYMTIMVANSAIYFHSNTLLEKQHLALIEPYSLAGFMDVWLLLGISLLILLIIVIVFPLRRLARHGTWMGAVRWTVLVVALGVIDIPGHIASLKVSDARLDKVVIVFRNAQLEYSAQNPIWGFVNDIVLRNISESLYSMQGSDTYRKYMKNYTLFSKDYDVSGDVSRFSDVVRQYNLSLGERSYRDLGLKPFKKVVVIFVESLTLDLLHCHNPDIEIPVSPHLCSEEFNNRSFTNFRTSGSPTLQGLLLLFSSHPNYNIQKLTGDRNSLLRLTRKHGYRNVFIRSASKFFANENIIFKKWGFDRIIAREDFFQRPELKKYIYGWGLEDRVLYDEVVDYIDAHRNEKLFLSVLGTDTHPPHGKSDFRHLKYPDLPPGFSKAFRYASSFMKSIHHADHDLKRFIDRLKERGLFGDDTLVVVTSDHSCPPNAVTKGIPNHPRHSLGRVPLIFITPQTLPDANIDIVSSQLDFAPTLSHLMGLPVLKGWWGKSLFARDIKDLYIGFHRDMVHIETGGDPILMDMKDPKGTDAEEFKELFTTVITDSPGD